MFCGTSEGSTAAAPIFVLCIAGMQQVALLEAEMLHSDRGCRHRFQPEWARVVSGVDEGVFGWIALNYATGHLAVNPALAVEAAATGPPADGKLLDGPGQHAHSAGAFARPRRLFYTLLSSRVGGLDLRHFSIATRLAGRRICCWHVCVNS